MHENENALAGGCGRAYVARENLGFAGAGRKLKQDAARAGFVGARNLSNRLMLVGAQRKFLRRSVLFCSVIIELAAKLLDDLGPAAADAVRGPRRLRTSHASRGRRLALSCALVNSGPAAARAHRVAFASFEPLAKGSDRVQDIAPVAHERGAVAALAFCAERPRTLAALLGRLGFAKISGQ
ncbi:MAG: hypothetical protein ABSC25_00840 [Roseiarcus sp.]